MAIRRTDLIRSPTAALIIAALVLVFTGCTRQCYYVNAEGDRYSRAEAEQKATEGPDFGGDTAGPTYGGDVDGPQYGGDVETAGSSSGSDLPGFTRVCR